jgi:hypothetical protein
VLRCASNMNSHARYLHFRRANVRFCRPPCHQFVHTCPKPGEKRSSITCCDGEHHPTRPSLSTYPCLAGSERSTASDLAVVKEPDTNQINNHTSHFPTNRLVSLEEGFWARRSSFQLSLSLLSTVLQFRPLYPARPWRNSNTETVVRCCCPELSLSSRALDNGLGTRTERRHAFMLSGLRQQCQVTMRDAADNALSPAAQRARQPILDCNIIRIFG